MKEYIIKNNLSPAPAAAAQPQVAPVSAAPAADQAKTSKPAGPVHPEYEPDFEDIELSNMRRVIAKRLVLSKVSNVKKFLQLNCFYRKLSQLPNYIINLLKLSNL